MEDVAIPRSSRCHPQCRIVIDPISSPFWGEARWGGVYPVDEIQSSKVKIQNKVKEQRSKIKDLRQIKYLRSNFLSLWGEVRWGGVYPADQIQRSKVQDSRLKVGFRSKVQGSDFLALDLDPWIYLGSWTLNPRSFPYWGFSSPISAYFGYLLNHLVPGLILTTCNH